MILGKKLDIELVTYHFFQIESEYMLHWIWYPIIVGCIGKGREIMLANKICCSFSHNSAIEFIHTMVSKVPLINRKFRDVNFSFTDLNLSNKCYTLPNAC